MPPFESAGDAALPPERLRAMSGLDLMRAVQSGAIAPPSMAATMNVKIAELEEGRVVFEGEPTVAHLNPLGFVHGGWALTLLDSVTGCAAHTTLSPGLGYTTIETKGNFVRAILPQSGLIRAEGKVVAKGRTIITAEGRIADAAGRLLAHGVSTLMVLRPQNEA
ncbi:MAG: PaaI family thioesterase [Hydrogenophilaceae bacterium]|nr:PaaI family thioesterase [Hydrogenophilaceae bacterium]